MNKWHYFCFHWFTIYLTANSSKSFTRYDKSATQFSDEGELLQVSYAKVAALRGSNLICIPWCEDLILLAFPTLSGTGRDMHSNLLERRSVDNVARVHDSVWIAFSGLAGDGRSLLKQARNFAVEFNAKISSFPSANSIANHIGQLQHAVTLSGDRRPYGVNVLTIGVNEGQNTIAIYQSDPSGLKYHFGVTTHSVINNCQFTIGQVFGWRAVAIGKESEKNARRLEQLLGSEDSLKTDDDLQKLFKAFQIDPFDENEVAPVVSQTLLEHKEGEEDGSTYCRRGSCVAYRFYREAGRESKVSMRFFKSPAEFMRSLSHISK